jgi:hydroxymethylbilane synthase
VRRVRIATRGSDLALWQARRVAALIEARCGFSTELVIVESHGDKDRATPLDRFSAVGVFTKALEDALLDGRADVAVHSMKDLPTVQPPELCIAAIPERADARDLLLARRHVKLSQARFGTSSKRRTAQLRRRFYHATFEEIRGNVPTRVEKLRRGDFDAIVLAAAGVERLGLDLSDLDVQRLSVDRMVPAPAQGALAIEARTDDTGLVATLREKLHDANVGALVESERMLLRLVEGGCSVPLGAHATREPDGRILLRAMLEWSPALVRASTLEAAARLAFQVLAPSPEITATALAGKTVTILREPDDAAELLGALARGGARGVAVPVRKSRNVASEEERLAALEALPPGAFVLFASANAAFGLSYAPDLRDPLRGYGIGAVGPGTARELAKYNVPLDLLAERQDGLGLAEAFLALGLAKTTTVLLPRAKEGRPELGNALRSAGYEVRELILYESDITPLASVDDDWDAIFVASPSGAEALPQAAFRAKLVAIGETTAAALRARGFAVAATAARPTTAGIVEALAAALSC